VPSAYIIKMTENEKPTFSIKRLWWNYRLKFSMFNIIIFNPWIELSESVGKGSIMTVFDHINNGWILHNRLYGYMFLDFFSNFCSSFYITHHLTSLLMLRWIYIVAARRRVTFNENLTKLRHFTCGKTQNSNILSG
jgi:hypothetical protein